MKTRIETLEKKYRCVHEGSTNQLSSLRAFVRRLLKEAARSSWTEQLQETSAARHRWGSGFNQQMSDLRARKTDVSVCTPTSRLGETLWAEIYNLLY